MDASYGSNIVGCLLDLTCKSHLAPGISVYIIMQMELTECH